MDTVDAPGGGERRGGGQGGRPGGIGRLLAAAVLLAAVAAVLALSLAVVEAVTGRRAAAPPAGAAGSGTAGLGGAAQSGLGGDTRRVRARGAREIVIDFDSGRLALEPAAGDVAEATVERRWSERPPTFGQRFEGGVLRIVSRCPEPGGQRAGTCRVRGRVSVPAGARVRADLGAGDVTAEAVRGDLELVTTAGSIRVAGLAGPVRLRADAGSIAAVDLDAPSFQAHSGAGNVTASFLVPPSSVDATTGAGSVALAVPAAGYAVDATAGVGRVSVEVPDDPAAPRRVLARTGVGEVRISPR